MLNCSKFVAVFLFFLEKAMRNIIYIGILCSFFLSVLGPGTVHSFEIQPVQETHDTYLFTQEMQSATVQPLRILYDFSISHFLVSQIIRTPRLIRMVPQVGTEYISESPLSAYKYALGQFTSDY